MCANPDQLTPLELPDNRPLTKMCVPWRVRLKRYTPSIIWRRVRQPLRRYMHRKRHNAFCTLYTRPDVNLPDNNNSTVLAIGNISDTTGLSRAFRAEVEHFKQEYTHTFQAHCLSAIPPEKLDADGYYTDVPDHLILLGQPDMYKKILQLFRPNALKYTYRTGFAVWEMPHFPQHWKPFLDLVHQVYTPSRFSGRALGKGIDPATHIRIRPHHLLHTPRPKSVITRHDLGIAVTDFLGMAIMDLRTCPDRKNPHGTILAWQQAFAHQSDKVLLVKARFSDKTAVIKHELQDLMRGYPNIRFVEKEFSHDDMQQFQSLADVYVSLHRAEGYGLNIAEMLALGVPSIVTDWSGNTDFTDTHPLALRVPVQLIPYTDYLGTYHGKNLQWAEPDIRYAAQYLRQVAKTTG